MQRFPQTLDEDISHRSGMNMYCVYKYIYITYCKIHLETRFYIGKWVVVAKVLLCSCLSVLGDFYHVDMQLLGDSGWLLISTSQMRPTLKSLWHLMISLWVCFACFSIQEGKSSQRIHTNIKKLIISGLIRIFWKSLNLKKIIYK